ncbi:hypothetical protein MKW98_012748 [Papaver atlanticum]|uniref:Uncharacterized protein n=1 Tax=Papaver atlanticum TaxID=357466 RepID=A0AAD4XQU4_9MAGN|nr:hypothetical protein MKW98_012748 [Papaver atlanticum]
MGKGTCSFLLGWVANEWYVVLIPENLPLDVDAPLLCAGVTVYNPMKYMDFVNLHLTAKEKEVIEHLGADSFLVSHNQEQMKELLEILVKLRDKHRLLRLLQMPETCWESGLPMELPMNDS